MKRLLLMAGLALLAATPALAFPVAPPAPIVVSTVSPAKDSAPVSAPTTGLLEISTLTSLVGFSVIGATAKTKKVNLPRDFIFNGVSYAAGRDVVVPDDFPDLDDNGDVQFPEGSRAAQNQSRTRSFGSPPSTGGVETGQNTAPSSSATRSGKTIEELDAMTKADLEELSLSLGIDVTRGDGSGGEPLKQDYVDALSAPANGGTGTPPTPTT